MYTLIAITCTHYFVAEQFGILNGLKCQRYIFCNHDEIFTTRVHHKQDTHHKHITTKTNNKNITEVKKTLVKKRK